MGVTALMSVTMLLAACSPHPAVGPGGPGADFGAAGAQTPSARYALEWDGRPVGTETVRVDRRDGHARWRGQLDQTEPLDTSLEWELWLEPARGELAGFEIRLRVLEETVWTRGWREGDRLRLEGQALGQRRDGGLGYGPGTAVELGSPLSMWWAGRRLLPALDPGDAADVRCVVVRPPTLAPEVQVLSVRRDSESELAIEGPGDERTRIELDPDGWPRLLVTDRPRWARSLIRRRLPAPEDVR